MLTNLWYVAEWSETVKSDPVKVKMLGQQFVLFRDNNGKVSCLSDVCLHRGGSLGNGKATQRNCVACPYHGWEFDTEGEVKFIPSLGEGGEIPARARIDAYPTQERYGMIWVFMGDLDEKDRYSIPDFPEYEDPNWKPVYTEFTWQAPVERVVENGIDIAHASFVHPGFGYPEMADKARIDKLERHDTWATTTNTLYPPPLDGGFGLRRFLRKDKQATIVHNTFYLPGHCIRLHIEINTRMHTLLFDCNTPVDENTTRSFVVQLRNFFKWDIFDKDSIKRTLKVFEEDAHIVENASPNNLPEDLEHEVSVKHDRFMGTWRSMRRKHVDMGWEIDSQAVTAAGGKTVFCIPSPKRREHPEVDWVLETVPLLNSEKKLVIASDKVA